MTFLLLSSFPFRSCFPYFSRTEMVFLGFFYVEDVRWRLGDLGGKDKAMGWEFFLENIGILVIFLEIFQELDLL
ncbi:hypothetical protein V6Z11_A01G142800 [Gossypium hirsutum]